MRLFRRRRPKGPPEYRNRDVIRRIQHDGGVDQATAEAWFAEMLVFLDMVAASRDFLSPSKPVDVAWHAFILHTRDYERYCTERYGRVIHHQPTGAPDPDAYRRAYEARSAYGPLDNTVWWMPAGVAAAGVVGAGEERRDEDGDEHAGQHAYPHAPEGAAGDPDHREPGDGPSQNLADPSLADPDRGDASAGESSGGDSSHGDSSGSDSGGSSGGDSGGGSSCGGGGGG